MLEDPRFKNKHKGEHGSRTSALLTLLKIVVAGGGILVVAAILIFFLFRPARAQIYTPAYATAELIRETLVSLTGDPEFGLEQLESIEEVLSEMIGSDQLFVLSTPDETFLLSADILIDLGYEIDPTEWRREAQDFLLLGLQNDFVPFRILGNSGSTAFAVSPDGTRIVGPIWHLSRLIGLEQRPFQMVGNCSDWVLLTRSIVFDWELEKFSACMRAQCRSDLIESCTPERLLREVTLFSDLTLKPDTPVSGYAESNICFTEGSWKVEYFVGTINLQFLSLKIGEVIEGSFTSSVSCDGRVELIVD